MKIRTILFPTTFISVPEKICVGLKKKKKRRKKKEKKQWLIFNFTFLFGEGLSDIPVLNFLPVQNEGVFSDLGYEILI